MRHLFHKFKVETTTSEGDKTYREPYFPEDMTHYISEFLNDDSDYSTIKKTALQQFDPQSNQYQFTISALKNYKNDLLNSINQEGNEVTGKFKFQVIDKIDNPIPSPDASKPSIVAKKIEGCVIS